MFRIKSQRSVSVAISGLVMCLAWHGSAAEPVIDFNRDIRPILAETCFQCHGPDAKNRKAKLRLDQGKSVATVVTAGNPSESELIDRILSEDAETQMPPSTASKQLNGKQKQLLVQWVQDGARYPRHWAFEPLATAKPPQVTDTSWPRNEIDPFVMARLQEEGLQPAGRAELVTLLRRISL
ncbi:MAG: c-type cytochrome domain-containing protein, partial [Pirellulaceae bacterium]